MSRLLRFLGSKVMLAILGALLIGGVSATLAFGTVARRPGPAANLGANSGGTTATVGATATGNATAGATTTTTSTGPTGTATPIATTGATATATPSGQTVSLRGTITAIITAPTSFTLHIRSTGASDTIVVDGNTAYSGSAAQFSDLTVNWTATVTAIAQPDGTYLATAVNANNNNDN